MLRAMWRCETCDISCASTEASSSLVVVIAMLTGIYLFQIWQRLWMSDDGLIVVRTVRLARALGMDVALVGAAAPYAALALGVPRLDDAPPGVGPLGGLAALLAWAGARPAIAVACGVTSMTVTGDQPPGSTP